MDEKVWDLQEVKRLKKKSLIEFNLGMLLIFLIFTLYINMGWSASVFFGIVCLVIWLFITYTFYILITGKTSGTKTNKLIQAFDRDRLGDQRWKRRKVAEVIFLIVLGVVCTLLVFPIEMNSEPLHFVNMWPFMDAWFGANIGSVIRMIDL